jgi:hypothetical protein
MCLAHLALDKCEEAEKLRGEIFRLTHPRREHFEKEGWPAASSVSPISVTHGACHESPNKRH